MPKHSTLSQTCREGGTARQDVTISRATLRAATLNDGDRTVEAVLATDARSTVFDMRTWSPVEEILLISGAELPEQIVLVDSHPELRSRDAPRLYIDDVRGSVRSLKTAGNQLLGTLHFASTPETQKAWDLVQEGHITDVSPGIQSIEQTRIPPGKTMLVNGKTYTANELPLYITTRWRPRELSLVCIGADAKAKLREDIQKENYTMTFRQYLESIGLRADATDKQAEEFFGMLEGDRLAEAERLRTASPPAPPAAPPETPGPLPIRRHVPPTPAPAPLLSAETVRAEAVRAERERITAIRELAGDDVPAEIRLRAETEGWDTARASQEFLASIRGGRTPAVGTDAPAGHVRSHDVDCTRDALSAGLMLRNSLPIVNPNASDHLRQQQERQAEQGDRYRDVSLLDICREACRIEGVTVGLNRTEMIRAAVSTASLSHIFTTSVNAKLLASYEAYPDSTVGWVEEEDVSNFLSNERIALDKMGGLDRHPRGSTAKHAERSSAQETYKVYRYAKQFVVDEQDIIDDRLSALMTMPAEMGESAGRLRPDLIYSILLANAALGADSVALFHANHSNLTTAVLGETGLTAALIAIAKQTDNNVNLNLRAQYLVIPHDLVFTARKLIRSAEILQKGNTDASFPTYNPLQDQNLKIVADNRIGAAGVTDPVTGTKYTGSATKWFLSTGGKRTLIAGYLAGSGRRPQLRSFTLDQGQWGIGWDVKMDIGAKALDYRGLHYSAGSG